jgi:hypothetical protein
VSGVLQQREQLLHLAPRRRRPCLLSECHAPSLPARPRTPGDGPDPQPKDDPPPDPEQYLASAARLMQLQPRRVQFSHDTAVWEP